MGGEPRGTSTSCSSGHPSSSPRSIKVEEERPLLLQQESKTRMFPERSQTRESDTLPSMEQLNLKYAHEMSHTLYTQAPFSIQGSTGSVTTDGQEYKFGKFMLRK